MNIELQRMIIDAEAICHQLKEVRNLPEDVHEILTGKPVIRVKSKEKAPLPGKPVLIHHIMTDGKTLSDTCDIEEHAESSGAQSDDIEILTKDNILKNDGVMIEVSSDDNDSEMFSSATQSNDNEQVVVLSNQDKPVF